LRWMDCEYAGTFNSTCSLSDGSLVASGTKPGRAVLTPIWRMVGEAFPPCTTTRSR
jgi:hypothetical protein